ncbi:PREDICTED: nodal homolog 2-A-like [Nanorana parkeri]|uniref:nodal homolog 2-A-like n=1 Tax=Nanorana parkeri TaxID=125878 RepID=UPI0008545A0B|nr:PREDICTED: nodal homolog 2-A-like [Nanorana parkeri]
MAWQCTAFLSFTLITLVLGRPSGVDRRKSSNVLPVSRITLKASSTHHGNRNSQGLKVPLYMMQLYKSLIMANDTEPSLLEHPALWESDSVLSLAAKHCSEKDNVLEIAFDMTSIETNNELKLAELRILPSSFKDFSDITLDIFHGTEGSKKIFIGSLQSTSTSISGSTWKAYNLTNMIQKYLYHSASKKVKDTSDGSVSTKCNGMTAEKVMLVVFSKDRQSLNLYGSPSIIKAVESSKYVRAENDTIKKSDSKRHRRSWNTKHSIIRNSISSIPAGNGKPLCRKVDMFVDFEVLGWGEQIVYPKRFNAYRCEGSCPIPLNELFKPSNHAYMQSLVKFNDPEKVACPLCAPVKMRPLSMLMYEGEKIVLKHHEDMIVEDCGCT